MKKSLLFSSCRLMLLLALSILSIFGSCEKNDNPGVPDTKGDPADVAFDWIKMQQKLLVGIPGILPHVAGRTYAYVGLALYESVVPGMSEYQSIAPQLNGELVLPKADAGNQYHWPASANAALAHMLRNLLPHAAPALVAGIDSLEAHHKKQFESIVDAETIKRSAEFGRQIASAIFEWSKSDGAHEAYKSPFSDTYVPPTGAGKWVSTGEFPFSQPAYPFWGNNRTFVPDIAEATQPPPPPEYSEAPGSAFYEAVNEIYTMSQSLTREDSLTARFWAYVPLDPEAPAKHGDVSHAANIAMQAMVEKAFSLQDAAVLFCKHGIAGNEAGISCVRAKFFYNLVRPITYIRTVMGHTTWKPVILTPPFPEYTSGHAAVSMSYAAVLEATFGKNFAFTDHSFADSYGPRNFDSFEAYAKEAAFSRLLGGIHYRFAMDEGLKQGRKTAEKVLQLKFKR
jgi:hypothetical protein